MKTLLPHAEKVAALLKARKQTVAIAESSAGGLIAASLLAVPGASAYFIGGAVIYTRRALLGLKNVSEDALGGLRGATEPYALLKARTIRDRFGAVWGVAEAGAAGPTGNRYGDPAGHTCLAIAGANFERATTLETGASDRVANMYAFAAAALKLFADVLAGQ